MAASRQSLTDLPTERPDEHPGRDRSWLDGRWRSGGLGEMDDVFTTHPHLHAVVKLIQIGEMDDVFTTHPHQLLHQLLVLEPLRLLVAQTLLLVLLVL